MKTMIQNGDMTDPATWDTGVPSSVDAADMAGFRGGLPTNGTLTVASLITNGGDFDGIQGDSTLNVVGLLTLGPRFYVGIDVSSSFTINCGSLAMNITSVDNISTAGGGNFVLSCLGSGIDADAILVSAGGNIPVNTVLAPYGTYAPDFPSTANVTTDDTTNGAPGLIPKSSVLVAAGGSLVPDYPNKANVTSDDTTNGQAGEIPKSKVMADAGGSLALSKVLTTGGGNYHAPSGSIVKDGEHFGANNNETGTYVGDGGGGSSGPKKRAFVGR